MRKLMVASLVASALLMGPALAGEPGFVGNTIKSQTPTWGMLSFFVGKDGSYKASDGTAGKWTYEGDKLCFNSGQGDPLCGKFDAAKKVGDVWEDAAWDGNGMAKITLVAGESL